MSTVVSRIALTAGQHRAARAMLGWGLIEAGRSAGVSIGTILALEKTDVASERDRKAVASAYEAAGIAFCASGTGEHGLTLKLPVIAPSPSRP